MPILRGDLVSPPPWVQQKPDAAKGALKPGMPEGVEDRLGLMDAMQEISGDPYESGCRM